MKNTLAGFAASVAIVSLATGAFAQASGGAAAGNSGGIGNNNTVEKQTGKTTSDAPGSVNPDDVQKPDTTGSVAPSTPDNRSKQGTNKGEENPANPVVK